MLAVDERTWLLVLTGAGISAESGIPTFRAAGGLWDKHPVEKVATPEAFRSDPALVWRFYGQRRADAKRCEPNPGHRALASIEKRLGERMLVATQNVDGLHRRAGSQRLVELHGNLFKTRCSRCHRDPFDDSSEYEGGLPTCDVCTRRGERALLRPHIVWFGEMLDPADLERVDAFMQRAAGARFVFLAVGTSGAVFPAAGFVDAARRLGAETWLVNTEPPDNRSRFEHFIEGPSGKILPALFDVG